MKESPIQRDIRLHLGQKDDLVIYRNNVGAWEDDYGNWTHYGLCVGSSDLVGILRPHGRWFCLEIKSLKGRTDKARAERQRLFRDLINSYGGYAAQASSAAEAEMHYHRARGGMDPP